MICARGDIGALKRQHEREQGKLKLRCKYDGRAMNGIIGSKAVDSGLVKSNLEYANVGRNGVVLKYHDY